MERWPECWLSQVALSITLLAGAGLLLRSLHNIQSVPMGFQPENVAVATINTSVNHYSAARSHALLEDLMQRAETIHGVRAVSAALVSPLSGTLWLVLGGGSRVSRAA